MEKRCKNKLTKLIAGCLAAFITIGSVTLVPGNREAEVQAYSFTEVAIDKTHFPDNNFRAYIKEAFDTNKNNRLDSDEILVARNIWCDSRGVESLEGIQYLKELRGLYCRNNKLKTLDLSGNQLITGVWVSNNLFTSLDFSKNPTLEWLYCFDNPKLTKLNVADNPKMSYLEVNTCPLGTIDVSHNPLLEHLTCAKCGLKSLNVRNNKKLTHLDCQENDLTSLDVTNCPLMKRLDVWGNKKLGSVNISKCTGLQYYSCAQTGISSIDVSRHTELTKLICSYNSITKLDVTHNSKLVYLDCNNNRISSLNLSNNSKLHFLQAFTNSIKSLSIGDNPLLIKTYQKGTKKWEPNAAAHSYKIDYGIDDSYGGLDNLYFLCVDDDVAISTTHTKAADQKTSYFEGDVSNTSELLTREMVAVTLYKLAGSPSVSGLTSRFTDVEPGAWYYNALLWGEKNNVCLGFPDMISDTFGIGRWCTKEEMVCMVMRFAEYMGYSREIDFGRSDDYVDYYDVDYSAWEAVTWAATYRILPVTGSQSGDKSTQRINPRKVTTRADLKYIINGLQEANGVSITSVPIPDASYLPANPDKTGELSGYGTKNQWVKTADGKYNYYDKDGKKETNCYRDGCWLDSSGNYNPAYSSGTWKCNSTGWWYEDSGWYPYSQWLKIDGCWYYFCSDGYMDYSEYRDGCWLGSNGAWIESYSGGHWCKNAGGWWYEDSSGWYPYSQYLWVDGTKYHFDGSGYWDY